MEMIKTTGEAMHVQRPSMCVPFVWHVHAGLQFSVRSINVCHEHSELRGCVSIDFFFIRLYI